MASILVIEDVAAVRLSLRMVLEGNGHRVTGAAGAEAALAALERAAFALVITDIWMPGRDGTDIIGEARGRWPGTRFLAITGGDPSGRAPREDLRGQDFGADAVLLKPFEKQELLEAVARLLATPAAAAPAMDPAMGPARSFRDG
jgi:CheY-like chemotaxis protein